MKLMKTLMAFGLAMTMTVSMSAVSYAQIPLSMMIASTAPITMQKNAYQLCLDQATVKHTAQTSQALSLPQQEAVTRDDLSFYPGDTLYIPILDVKTGELYSEKIVHPTGTSGQKVLIHRQYPQYAGQMKMEHSVLPLILQDSCRIPVHFGLVALLHFTMNRPESNRAVCI